MLPESDSEADNSIVIPYTLAVAGTHCFIMLYDSCFVQSHDEFLVV